MTESREFRMPTQALHTQLIWAIAFAAFAGVSAFFLQASVPPIVLAFSIGAFVVATLVVYPLSRRRVWVTTSAAGMQGRGAFGLRVRHSWQEPVLVVRRGSGVQVIAVDADGIPKSFASIFVPQPILLSKQFQAEVAHYAGGKHPLRIGAGHV